MSTQLDVDSQDKAAALLREGARLLYTVAAGQFFQLGDVNAWFEQYNAFAQTVGQDLENEHYGVIGERTSESDPLVDQAAAALADIAARAEQARSDYDAAVQQSRQGGGQ